MSEVQETKPREYLIGLTLGTLVAGAAWFLYKTKKGRHLRLWWEKYFNELRDEWLKLQETEAVKAPPAPRRRRPKPKKKLFLKSGKPLVK